jgi:hypothetical protein
MTFPIASSCTPIARRKRTFSHPISLASPKTVLRNRLTINYTPKPLGAMLFSRLKQKTDGLTQMMRCKPVVSTPRNLRYFTSGRHAASMLHASNWGLVAMALPIFGSANPRRRKSQPTYMPKTKRSKIMQQNSYLQQPYWNPTWQPKFILQEERN